MKCQGRGQYNVVTMSTGITNDVVTTGEAKVVTKGEGHLHDDDEGIWPMQAHTRAPSGIILYHRDKQSKTKESGKQIPLSKESGKQIPLSCHKACMGIAEWKST